MIFRFTNPTKSLFLSEEIILEGLKRTYILHIPTNIDQNKTLPLVIVLHGGGGDGKGRIKLSRFNALADKEVFVAVYPNGIDKNRNDDRIAPKKSAYTDKINHVKFISALIDKLVAENKIDKTGIFATGISKGGIFLLYLTHKLSHKISAIAALTASIPDNLAKDFTLGHPVSLLLINGTANKLVKYEGGAVLSQRSGRGSVIATEVIVKKRIQLSSCNLQAKVEGIPDRNMTDGSKAIKYAYSGGKNKSDVFLVKWKKEGILGPAAFNIYPKRLSVMSVKILTLAKRFGSFLKDKNQGLAQILKTSGNTHSLCS